MTNVKMTAQQVLDATDYTQVFGAFTGDEAATKRHIQHGYHKLSRQLHPDLVHGTADEALAGAAFRRLNDYRNTAHKAAERGQYGQMTVLATVKLRKATYEITHLLQRGDLCTLYEAQTPGSDDRLVCKLARMAGDKDLLQAEAAALKRLRGPDADPKYHAFVPELLGSFAYAEAGKPARQANMLRRLDGFYDLKQVAAAFPTGIAPLHMVWIWRRLLVALGHAHDNLVVHGAVLPAHVMIHPEFHGLVLIDWCYASVADDTKQPPIQAIVDRYKDWYPVEIMAKTAPSPATDIIMAARCMIYLLSGDPHTGVMPHQVPKPFRAFFRGCLADKQSTRPDDAWMTLREFDELLQRMGSPYYPRRFRPFTMPTGTV